ncbi:MAG TPA: cation:proton antiporter [bacterium]|nr:cation:proton antiporter [bacterium]HPN31828.1 cation:proton antiporter [bacterium]
MNILPVQDPVLIFAIVMLIVLIAPLLAKKSGFPDIVGLIIAGTLIGPYMSGILERNQTIELLGTVGLLYIMFQAGLEIDILQVKKNKHYSLIFGAFTFIFPLFFGILIGYYFFKMNLIASILLASMFSSHTLLTFPIVSRLGLAKKRAVTAAIGGTIFTDALALIILAVIISSNNGSLNYMFWAKFIVFSTVYSFGIIFFLPKIGSWFFKNFSSELGVEDYVFVIAALFTSAYFSHLAKLEPIIGAFLAGIALNSLIPEKSVLMNRIQFVGNSLFIPFFLISVGMIINPKLLFSNFETIKISAAMIIVALFSKWIAAVLFSKISGFSKTEGSLIFGLTVNQAAATLAAVLVGYKVGIFSSNILTGTIMMILGTCFAGPFITEKSSKKLILETKDKFDFKNLKRSDRILIPLKNPETINSLIDLALLLHPKNSHDPIYPLNIAIEGKDVQEQVLSGENILTKAVMRISAANKISFPLTSIDINVHNAIIKSVKEYRISKVALGWNENITFKHHLFGNTIDKYIKESREIIFVAAILQPLNISDRILLIIPPLIHKQNGFKDTLIELKKLSLSINAKIIFLAEQSAIEEILAIINQSKPVLSSDFIPVSSWKKIYNILDEMTLPNDIIIQMIARPGRLAWSLNFDKMPNQLKLRFPNNSIITVYPYYNIDEYDYEKEFLSNELTLLNLIPERNFYFNFEKTHIADAFKTIINSNNFKNPDLIFNQLSAVSKESPLELTTEISLLHIHTAEAPDYLIYIFTNEAGFKLNALDISPKIIIILLSPASHSTEGHLNILSEIAKIVQIKGFSEYLLASSNYSGFIDKLKSELNI